MSKSGLFPTSAPRRSFRSRPSRWRAPEFTEQVIEPSVVAPTGLERVRQLGESYLRYVEGGVYPGGCFFASVAAEMAMRPGPVRDGAVQV